MLSPWIFVVCAMYLQWPYNFICLLKVGVCIVINFISTQLVQKSRSQLMFVYCETQKVGITSGSKFFVIHHNFKMNRNCFQGSTTKLVNEKHIYLMWIKRAWHCHNNIIAAVVVLVSCAWHLLCSYAQRKKTQKINSYYYYCAKHLNMTISNLPYTAIIGCVQCRCCWSI